MDTIHHESRQQLRTAIRRYIKDDLLPDNIPIWLGGQWNKDNEHYTNLFRRYLRMVCSSCRYIYPNPNPNLNPNHNPNQDSYTNPPGAVNQQPRPPAQGAISWLIPSTVQTQQQMNTWISNRVLPTRITACLNDDSVKHTVWVWVCYTQEHGGNIPDTVHAILMLFDKKRKLQITFDPHGGINRPCDVAKALCHHQFHPHFQLVPMNRCMWQNFNSSLQERIETLGLGVDEEGVCALLCILVIMTCTRFNYYNPLEVANMLAPVMIPDMTTNKLISWYDELLEGNMTTAQIRARAFPDSEERKCRAFCPSSRKLCSRGSCSNGGTRIFCWQHRFIVLNNRAADKKCATAQEQCVN